MSDELCTFSLILPSWLVWGILVFGMVILLPGLIKLAIQSIPGRLNYGKKKGTVGNISPIFLIILGLPFLVLGAAGVTAVYHQPFARRLGEMFPILIDRADEPVSAELNDQRLSDLQTSTTGTYIVWMSPAARDLKVTGDYKDCPCDADLINQICRNQTDNLTCPIDRINKIIRVCMTSDDAPPCKNSSR